MDLENRIQQAHNRVMNDTVARQVANSGRNRMLAGIDLKDMYHKMFPEVPNPTSTDFTSSGGRQFAAEKFLEKVGKDWKLIQKSRTYVVEDKMYKSSFYLLAKDPGLLLTVNVSYRSGETKNSSKERAVKAVEMIVGGDYVYSRIEGKEPVMESVTVYHPNSWDPLYSEDDLDKIKDAFEECLIEDSGDASIGIISCDQGEYYVKNFSLSGKTPPFTHPDLHYGEGFEEFHNSMISRIGSQTKGLILLHGDPGTGKTQYIRVLLKELAAMNKSVLYAPPSLSASLTEPEMIEFISDWVIESEKDCILLIEDAEPLLEARNGFDGRTTGISNLLNMTDGLLNDILGLMVIATFNTELSKIDSALLRPQRLLARKMFKKMPKDRAEKLASELNIEMPDIKYPASLAEFYAANQNHNVLIHDLDEERKMIGFGR